MNKLLPLDYIKNNLETTIKYMCYNLLITIDNQTFNLSLKPMSEKLVGGSYCYYCNGRYRTKKWIRENSVEILGFVTK